MGKKSAILIGIISAAILLSSKPSPARDTGLKASPNDNNAGMAGLAEAYGKLPLYFIKNNGQADARVRYYEKGAGHAVYFTDDGLYINLLKRTAGAGKGVAEPHKPAPSVQSEVIRFGFAGAVKAPRIEALDRQQGTVNYFTGNDRAGWRTGVPTYGAIVYKDAYNGIDVKYYGNNNELEYDVIVRPGANPSAVRFFYEGVKGMKVNNEGGLEIALAHGTITQKRPFIYQTINNRKVEVKGGFEILGTESGRHSYGFQVASYDKARDLVIDPSLVFSTYLGGGGVDDGNSVAIDSSGNTYITGYTVSTDFPLAGFIDPYGNTIGPIQGTGGGSWDVFVSKLNTSGNALVYSTYLGGSGFDYGYGIAVDASGNAYVTGETSSANFPTASPLYGTNAGYNDAFIAKINSTGSALVYSTYLGGARQDYGKDIALDAWGNAYVTGYTTSADFPTVSPLLPHQIQTQTDIYGRITYIGDGFVVKLNPTGSALANSTFLGGTSYDYPASIATRITMDAYGNLSGGVYVTGYTYSTNFPTAAPFYATNSGASDVFVTKINPTWSALAYSTYLGGASSDYGSAIAVDPAGNAYITGTTYSTNFPTASPIYGPRLDLYGGYPGDAFVTKLNASGNALSYSTYLGGTAYDSGYGIAVDNSGNAYVTGYTLSTNFPVASPLYSTLGGGYDAFVTKLNPAGSALSFSTYLGGSGNDYGRSIVVDGYENAYVAGQTYSTNFPTVAPFQPANAGLQDVFAAKISTTVQQSDLTVSSLTAPATARAGISVSVSNTVTNSGTGASNGSYTRFYLSTDTNITTSDTYIGQRYIGSLASGASNSATTSLLIPSSVAPGTYYIGAIADATNTNAESNESNNTTASSAVAVSGSLDLVVSALSGPTSVTKLITFYLSNTVKNNGTGASNGSYTRFYLSTDTNITTSDIYIGQRYVGSLASGASSSASSPVTISSTTLSGTYYIGAITDATNTNPEYNESNNKKYYGPVTVQ
ncbi:MAG: SBBP repeat-containing protein [Deltaproteobacteria bacterium]|nr:SBBP repeat-containing protein [Deltaproteobacteria bacterium]